MNSKKEAILLAFWEASDEFPEKSTEFVVSIVCDRTGCDSFDVMDVLFAEAEKAKGADHA